MSRRPKVGNAPGVRGFTLVELLVTLAVLGILLGAAVPTYRGLVLDNARATTVNDLVAALTLARTEAQKQQRQIVVCPLASGTCAPSAANWNNGWLVFVDMDPALPVTFDPGDPVIAFFERRNAHTAVRSSIRAFAMRPSPRRSQNGTVSFCDRRGTEHARAVIVAPSGRVRISGSVETCA